MSPYSKQMVPSHSRIFVRVKPRAKAERVERLDFDHYAVWVKEPPERGLANVAVAKVLGQHFGKSPFLVKVVSGHSSRQKIIELS